MSGLRHGRCETVCTRGADRAHLPLHRWRAPLMLYILLTFLLCGVASAQVVDPPLRVTVRTDDVTCAS